MYAYLVCKTCATPHEAGTKTLFQTPLGTRITCGCSTGFLEFQYVSSTIPLGCTVVESWDDQKTPVTKEKPEDRFPHRCPKCNRKCYLGLNQIEHEVEGYCR